MNTSLANGWINDALTIHRETFHSLSSRFFSVASFRDARIQMYILHLDKRGEKKIIIHNVLLMLWRCYSWCCCCCCCQGNLFSLHCTNWTQKATSDFSVPQFILYRMKRERTNSMSSLPFATLFAAPYFYLSSFFFEFFFIRNIFSSIHFELIYFLFEARMTWAFHFERILKLQIASKIWLHFQFKQENAIFFIRYESFAFFCHQR